MGERGVGSRSRQETPAAAGSQLLPGIRAEQGFSCGYRGSEDRLLHGRCRSAFQRARAHPEGNGSAQTGQLREDTRHRCMAK